MKTITRSPEYLDWLRDQPCAIGGTCAGRTQACHVRRGTDGGMGLKPSDQYALPMCGAHHGEQHMAGEQTFADRHGVNLLGLAAGYWSEFND